MVDLKRIIANNIYILRNQQHLTQQEFVDKLNVGLTRGHLSNIENGVYMPSAEFIKAVSDAFGVDTNWILSSFKTDKVDIDLTYDEIKFILTFRRLTDNAQNKVKDIVELIIK